MDTKDLVLELNLKLVAARHAYYAEASPIMTDEEYDKVEQELKTLVLNEPDLKRYATVLTTVGSDLRDSANRVKHKTPMLSLENNFVIADIQNWMRSLPVGTNVCLEPKIDGLSLSLRFIDRKLVLATTRGDGEVGEDVTAQVFASPNIPKTLHRDFPATPVEIRGEAFILDAVFQRLNAEAAAVGDKAYANTRNLAAGTLKLKNLKEVANRDLRIQPWEVHGLPDNPLGASKDLEYLATHNEVGKPSWRQAQLYRVSDPEMLPKAIEDVRKIRETVWHKGLGMQTDGIVLKVENRDLRKKLGHGSKYPNWACCFKFQSLNGVTELKGIEWSGGRSGILTPVGLLEPINLGGSVISRVNLNNMSFIQNLGLSLGCRVNIIKSGDVIPMVSALVEPGTIQIQAPSLCPQCQAKTEMIEDPKSKVQSCYCTDFNCPGKLKGHLVYIGQRTMLDIEGLGPQLVEKIVDDGVITDIGDLYLWAKAMTGFQQKYGDDKLEAQIRKEGYPVAQTLSLLRGLEGSLEMNWDKWLAALGIPGVGSSMAKAISQYLELDPEALPDLHKIILRIGDEGTELEGLGVRKFAEIEKWAKLTTTGETLQKLYDAGVRPKALPKPKALTGPTPLAGELICVTGEFDSIGDREYIQKCLVGLGAQIKGVSKKLTILCAGDGAGPSKLSKAKELGIRVENKKWLLQVLEQNKVELKPKFAVEDLEESMDDL
jgi:DNA ligase (NAD+)